MLILWTGEPKAEERVVHVYGWGDYIAPKVLASFTKTTGIKLTYDVYGSNETLEHELIAGHSGYDVVIPSSRYLALEIAAGLLHRLDKSRLPHIGGLWPEVMAQLAVHDPGNHYAVDYMWYTTGLAFNIDKARRRLGTQPINSWDILFKPKLLAKFADCGIDVPNDPADLFPIALNYLKLKPNSKRLKDLRRAAALLAPLRRSVTSFHNSSAIGALANGEICLAVMRSGNALQARARARGADNGINIGYVVPQEGTLMSLDALAIPNDAPDLAEAYAFIDYLLRPKIAAQNTQATRFANGVLASKPFVPPAIRNDKAIYPDDDVMQKLFTVTPYEGWEKSYVARKWQAITKGK